LTEFVKIVFGAIFVNFTYNGYGTAIKNIEVNLFSPYCICSCNMDTLCH
jgi:hypothetical protein